MANQRPTDADVRGSRPSDDRERAVNQDDALEHSTKVTISGPGAADFIASSGGLDRPETDRAKGMGQTSDDGLLSDARRLVPELEPSETDPEAGAPPRDPLRRI